MCVSDAWTLAQNKKYTVLRGGLGQLEDLLDCGRSCVLAARAIRGMYDIHSEVARQAVPALRRVDKDRCEACLRGDLFSICIDRGRYSLRALEPLGFRNDATKYITVYGRNCVATLYEHHNWKGWHAEFTEGFHDQSALKEAGAKPGAASSLIIDRHGGDCHYESQAALYKFGYVIERPHPQVLFVPFGKDWCHCSYRCNADPRTHHGRAKIPIRDTRSCEQSFKDFAKFSFCFGIAVAWDCRWS